MREKTKRQLDECYDHIQHIKKHKSSEELKQMCSICEAYNGAEHDYEECKERMCFKFWLAFEYLEWENCN